MADPNIRIKRSAVPGKRPTVEQLPSGEIALNTHDGELFIRRERSGIGTDIVRVAAGTTVQNILYVTNDGNDSNTGKKMGDAKATIKGAVAIAEVGTVIKVSAGTYIEDNPIKLPRQVSVVGESLREVSVQPMNEDDLFRVSNGNYIANMSFIGVSTLPYNAVSGDRGISCFSWDPDAPQYTNQSPYIQNCTNFIDNSIGLRIDGLEAIGPTKSMVLDSFTQYNPNGVGAYISNGAYAQLVSMFTICTDTAVKCESGGSCDLTNSNSSFGNFGLVADGVGSLQFTGNPIGINTSGFDEITLNLGLISNSIQDALYDNVTGLLTCYTSTPHEFVVGMAVTITDMVFDCDSGGGISSAIYPSGNNGYVFTVVGVTSETIFETYVGVSTIQHTYNTGGYVSPYIVRPFDGQVVTFGETYYEVESVNVSIAGTGYTKAPKITFGLPATSWGVPAQATAEVKDGSIVSINLISSGRGYTSEVITGTVAIPDAVGVGTTGGVGIGTSQTAPGQAFITVTSTPKYYLVESCTPIRSGICTVKLIENVPYDVGIGSTAHFYRQSRLLTSSHAFEYIGTGTNIDSAIPFNGAVGIPDQETVSTQGGLVVYTSTDQSGNFKVGDGVVINQANGTISGTNYTKSLFTTMTPFILALGGD